MVIKNHKDLDVWKLSIDFTTEVYRATVKFPGHEQYGLVSQLRRAAVSIASNIAEGAARKSSKEFAKFLHCALGSSSEIETQLIVSKSLKYIDNDVYNELSSKQTEIAKMISGLIRSLAVR